MAELTLRWNKFGLSKGLNEMLALGELVDVTLACQGEFVMAHKSVLAACSPHFRAIFKVNPWQQPVVFMQGVKVPHLRALLDFMYTGEATVNQQQLSEFLATAEALRIDGLTTSPKEHSSKQSQYHSHHQQPQEITPTIMNPMCSPHNTSSITQNVIDMEDSLDTHDSHSSKHIASSPSADILSENPPSVSSSEHGSQPCTMNKIKTETEQGMHSQAASWPLPIIADQIFNAQDFLQSQSTSQDPRHNIAQAQSSGQMSRQGLSVQDMRQSLGSPPQSSGSSPATKHRSAILNGKYFKVMRSEGTGVWAQCQLCLPRRNIIKGSWVCTSNFKTHLRSKHKDRVAEYEKYKCTVWEDYKYNRLGDSWQQPQSGSANAEVWTDSLSSTILSDDPNKSATVSTGNTEKV